MVIKRVTFRVFAMIFTPAYYALIHTDEEKLFSLVLNHLVISAGLNVGLVRSLTS